MAEGAAENAAPAAETPHPKTVKAEVKPPVEQPTAATATHEPTGFQHEANHQANALESQRIVNSVRAQTKTAASEALPDLPITKEPEKKTIRDLQDRMVQRLGTPTTGDTTTDQSEIADKVKHEQQQDHWGPESQLVFRAYITATEQRAKEAILQVDAAHAQLPPDAKLPAVMKDGSQADVDHMSDKDYIAKIKSGELQIKLPVSGDAHVPTDGELHSLDAAEKWISQAEQNGSEIHMQPGLETGIGNHYQDIMRARVEDITPDVGKGDDVQRALIADRLAKLKDEESRNVWGPESQKAFGDYVKWMETFAVPKTAQALDSFGIHDKAPAGHPAPIPTADGHVVSDEEYAKLLAAGKINAHLDVAVGPPHDQGTPHVPTLDEMRSIESARAYIQDSQEALKAFKTDWDDRHNSELIGHGIPKSYADLQPGESLEDHRLAQTRATNWYEDKAGKALVWDSLKELGYALPSPPPNIRVIHDANGGRHVEIDMPPNLSDFPTDQSIQKDDVWARSIEAPIKQATETLRAAKDNPYTNLLYGTIELPSGHTADGQTPSQQAAFDKDGNLLGIIDPAKKEADPPGTVKKVDVDALSRSLEVTRDDPNNPDSPVTIKIIVQAQQGRIGYDLFNKNVGNPMVIGEIHRNANDVVLYNGTLTPARLVEGRLMDDKAMYVGGKVFNIALDASMLIGGGGIIAKVALGGLKRAAVELAAADAAALVTTRATALATTRASAEFLAGAGGFVGNSAWGHDVMPWVDETRGIYFATTGVGSISKWFRDTTSGGETVQQALQKTNQKILDVTTDIAQATMSKLTPIMAAQIVQGMLTKDYIAYQIWAHGKEIDPKAFVNEVAPTVLSSSVAARTETGAPKPLLDGGAIKQSVGDLTDALTPSPGAKDSVRKILELAARFDPSSPNPLTAAEQDAVRKAWAQNLTYNSDSLINLDQLIGRDTGRTISGDQLQADLDPLKRTTLPDSIRQGSDVVTYGQIRTLPLLMAMIPGSAATDASTYDVNAKDNTPISQSLRTLLERQGGDKVKAQLAEFAHVNADIATASRLALLMTAKSNNGAPPRTLASVDVPVEPHQITEWTRHFPMFGYKGLYEASPPVLVPGKTVTQNVDTAAVVNGLRDDLARSTNPGARLAIAEVLFKAGTILPQEASSIIQKSLTDGRVDTDKVEGLFDTTHGAFISTVLDSLHQSEALMQTPGVSEADKAAFLAANYGNSYQDLLLAVAKATTTAPTESARAMALATYYGAVQLAPLTDHVVASSIELAHLKLAKDELAKGPDTPARAEGLANIDRQIAEQESSSKVFAQERTRVIEQLQHQLDDARSGSPGHMQDSIKQAAMVDLATPLPQEHPELAIEKRLAAAQMLSMINVAAKDQQLDRQITASLTAAFNASGPQQSMQMIKTLPDERVQAMIKAGLDTKRLMDLVPENGTDFDHAAVIGLLSRLPKLAKAAPDEFKKAVHDKLDRMLQDPAEIPNRDVQVAVVRAAGATKDQGLLSSLELLAPIEVNPNAEVREAVVRALFEMKDPSLKSMLPDMLSNETDPKIHALLQEIAPKLGIKFASADVDTISDGAVKRFVDNAAIALTAPDLIKLDPAATKEFLEKNKLTLLNHDQFVDEAMRRTQDAMHAFTFGWWSDQNDIMGGMIKERNDQFDALVKLANGRAGDPNTQKARAFLAQIVQSNGASVSPPSDTTMLMALKPFATVIPGLRADYEKLSAQVKARDPAALTPERSQLKELELVGTETPIDAPKLAAAALAQLGDTTVNGVPQDPGVQQKAYLLGDVLLANPAGMKAESELTLLDAYRQLYNPDALVHPISTEHFKYVLTRALEAEQTRRASVGQEKAPPSTLEQKLAEMLGALP